MMRRSTGLPGIRPVPPGAQAGFSLPEIMVVLAIILLLSVLAIPNYNKALEHSEEAAAQANLKRIHTGQEAHRVMTGSYAPSFEVLRDTNPERIDEEAETGQGAGAEESVMVHHGYIYRMERPQADRYAVIAEPIRNRARRPHYEMDFLGNVTMTIPNLNTGDDQEKDQDGSGTTSDEDQSPEDQQPPGAGPP